MKYGDLVYTNIFGEKPREGILIDVSKYFAYKVLLSSGIVKTYSFSQLLTVEEVEKYGFTAKDIESR